MQFTFNFNDTDSFGDKQAEISNQIGEHLKAKKDFTVEFKTRKSGKQLRGYWRLIGLVLPYLQESYGKEQISTNKDASNFIKIECGFFSIVKTKSRSVLLPKSLTKATKEELMQMIEKLYFTCEFFEIKDYQLKPQEQRDFEGYFNETK